MTEINSINIKDALTYMGIRGTPDMKTMQEIADVEKSILKLYQPHYLYEKYSIEKCGNLIRVLNTPVSLCGNDIFSHLEGCNDAVFLAATLSFRVDNFIKACQVTDMKRAVIADALANALIEQVCDAAEEEIQQLYPCASMTFRYSPGYGDFDISMQKTISDLLNTQKKIGVFVNESSMMIPSKSVIAVIGLKYGEKR